MKQMLRLTFLVAAGTLAGAWAQEQRPKNIPFYTWVREDTFAGWMNHDLVRHARGMKRAQEWLDDHPGSAEAINWLGTGKVYEATLAYAAGDAAKGDALYEEGLAAMEKGLTLAPTHPGILATTGGTLMTFARNLPDKYYRPAIERARDIYAVLYKLQQPMGLDRFPLHLKGEALAGIAETEFRAGDREKGIEFLKRIASSMPNTPYAKTAEAWLQAPESVTKQDRLVCGSCHEAGRISSWQARQPSAP
jgi:tetratricopeptide (TPR) repeat protein